MLKIIELNHEGIGRLAEREPFLLPDELELEFKTKSYDLSTAFISLKNGEEEGQYKLTSPFKVDKRFLFGGKLEISVKLYVGDVIVKQWAIIPIKLKETDYGIHAFDFMNELEGKYNTLYGKLNEVIEKHNALGDHVADMKENI